MTPQRTVRPVVLTVVVLLVALAAPPVVGGMSVQPDSEELEDGLAYWQGATLTDSNYADNASEAALYTESGSHVRNITLSDGALSIDTDSLEGRYYVTAPTAARVSFEILVEEVEVDVSTSTVREDPRRVTVDVGASSIRGGATLHVSSGDIPDFAERVSGPAETVDSDTVEIDRAGTLTVSFNDLGTGDYTIRAENVDSGVDERGTVSLTAADVPPEGEATSVTRGGDYWRPAVLAVGNATPNAVHEIEGLDGSPTTQQRATDSGTLYFSTTGFEPGIYRVLNGNGTEVSRFNVQVQTVEAVVFDDSVEVDSNRAGYSATATVANNSTSVTGTALPEASVENGTASFSDLSKEASLALDKSELYAGDYSVRVNVTGLEASVATSFSVAESPSESNDLRENTTTAVTSTTTGTATEVATSTATSSETTAAADSTTTSSVGSSGTGAPGFTVSAAVAALLAAGLIALSRRD